VAAGEEAARRGTAGAGVAPRRRTVLKVGAPPESAEDGESSLQRRALERPAPAAGGDWEEAPDAGLAGEAGQKGAAAVGVAAVAGVDNGGRLEVGGASGGGEGERRDEPLCCTDHNKVANLK